MPKTGQFGEFLQNWSLRSNSVTRLVSFNRQKLAENAKIQKFKCDILSNFQTMWCWLYTRMSTLSTFECLIQNRFERLYNFYFGAFGSVVKQGQILLLTQLDQLEVFFRMLRICVPFRSTIKIFEPNYFDGLLISHFIYSGKYISSSCFWIFKFLKIKFKFAL